MTTPAADRASVLPVLADGELSIEGRLVDASNAALVGSASLDGVTVPCIYKPTAGERPLWDFPDHTLGRREVATWAVSDAADWHLVPPTAWRDDGPAGQGMCQLWVDVAADETLVDVVHRGATPSGWLAVVDAVGPGGRPVTLVHADDARLRRMAVLDAVVNNADRKGGHVLRGSDGELYGVDHGLTFNVDDKLRTVLWGWAGEPLGDDVVDELDRLDDAFDGPFGDALSQLLRPAEIRATRQRLDHLRRDRVFPFPGDGWPSLPWPPF